MHVRVCVYVDEIVLVEDGFSGMSQHVYCVYVYMLKKLLLVEIGFSGMYMRICIYTCI